MPEETPSAAALEAAEEATQPNVLLEAIDTAEPPDGPQLRIVVEAQDQPDRDRPIDAGEAAIPDALEGGPSTVQIEEPQEIGEKAGGASLQQADKPTGGKPRREEKNRRRTLTAASRENRFVSDEKIVVPIVRNVYRNHAADYSRAYITRRFSVNSNIAQVLFEHNYDRIDYANYIVSLVIPSIAPQEISRRTNEALEALYAELEQKLDDTIASTQAMVAKRKLNDTPTSAYDHPRRYETPIRSPYSIRYLNIVAKYDRLNGLVDCLWLNGYLSINVRMQTSNLWQKRLRRFATALNELRMSALRETSDASRDRIRNGLRQTQEEARRVVESQAAPAAEQHETTGTAPANNAPAA